MQSTGRDGSTRIKIEADVVEPFSNQVLIAGIEDIGVVEQQNGCPVDEIAFRDEPEAFAFQRIGDMFPGDDDTGFGDGKTIVCGSTLRCSRLVLAVVFEIDIECASKRTEHFVKPNLKQGVAPEHIELFG